MGLLGGIARTAVIAGTATAVSNRVSRRQAGRWAEQEQQAGLRQPDPYVQPDVPPTAAAPSMDDKIAQLKTLGELRAQEVLTETEFAQQKAVILDS